MVNSRAHQVKVIIKKADETVNSSTTQQNDNELFSTLKPNRRYIVELRLLINCHTTPDFKYSSTLPSGATGKWLNTTWSASVVTPSLDHTIGIGVTCTGADEWICNSLSVVTGATGGLLNITFAQNSSSSEDTKMLAGSSIIVMEQ